MTSITASGGIASGAGAGDEVGREVGGGGGGGGRGALVSGVWKAPEAGLGAVEAGPGESLRAGAPEAAEWWTAESRVGAPVLVPGMPGVPRVGSAGAGVAEQIAVAASGVAPPA